MTILILLNTGDITYKDITYSIKKWNLHICFLEKSIISRVIISKVFISIVMVLLQRKWSVVNANKVQGFKTHRLYVLLLNSFVSLVIGIDFVLKFL